MSFAEIFASDFLLEIIIKALVVGVLVSVCSSLLGVSLVMKHYSMIGDGLSHVGYFALSIGAVAGVSGRFSTFLALPVVVLAAVLILKLDSVKMSGDAACAIVATGSVAIGTIIFGLTGTSTADICSSLFGSASIITVTGSDVLMSVLLFAVVISWFILFYRKIFALTFDEQFAAAAGLNTGSFKTVIALLTGVTIVVGMKMMGAIMISALIVFPAMTACRVCKSYKGVVICAASVSVVSFIIGFFAACVLSLQTGAAVVTTELCAFLIACAVSFIKGKIHKD